VEIDTSVNIDVRPAAQVIAERLDRLAQGAIQAAAKLADNGLHVVADQDIVDAEVVEKEETTDDSNN
jgi:hypothetical protein